MRRVKRQTRQANKPGRVTGGGTCFWNLSAGRVARSGPAAACQDQARIDPAQVSPGPIRPALSDPAGAADRPGQLPASIAPRGSALQQSAPDEIPGRQSVYLSIRAGLAMLTRAAAIRSGSLDRVPNMSTGTVFFRMPVLRSVRLFPAFMPCPVYFRFPCLARCRVPLCAQFRHDRSAAGCEFS